jgi:hypothetical protein
MKIYLASKYSRHKLNNNLKRIIEDAGENFEVLLPESLNLEEKTKEQRKEVREKCCQMIRKCDVLLAVEPFGRDVAYEIGYAQALKDCGKNIELLRIGKVPTIGAMVDPGILIDFESAVIGEQTGENISELLKFLSKIKR